MATVLDASLMMGGRGEDREMRRIGNGEKEEDEEQEQEQEDEEQEQWEDERGGSIPKYDRHGPEPKHLHDRAAADRANLQECATKEMMRPCARCLHMIVSSLWLGLRSPWARVGR